MQILSDVAGNGSVGMALMLGNDGIKENIFKERDMICLSLDGFRRAARLCCTLGESLLPIRYLSRC